MIAIGYGQPAAIRTPDDVCKTAARLKVNGSEHGAIPSIDKLGGRAKLDSDDITLGPPGHLIPRHGIQGYRI